MNDRLKFLHADLKRIKDALSYMESQKESLNKDDLEYYETLKKEKNLVESEIAKIN
jgi:hypothetical protein